MPRPHPSYDDLACLQAAYRSRLIEALEACAHGEYGLFDQIWAFMPIASREAVDDLIDLGEFIDAHRQRLGLGPFELHARFVAARAANDRFAADEPRQAREWLRRMQGC